MADSYLVFIVILNWNHAEDTLSCVASVRQINTVPVRVVVCDNASEPGDVDRLREGLIAQFGSLPELDAKSSAGDSAVSNSPVTLIHTGSNLGYAGGMNAGIRHAMGCKAATHVWVLNNDTEVTPDVLLHMLARMESDSRIGICGSTLVYHGAREKVQAWGGAAYQPWRARSMALGAFTATSTVPPDPSEVESQMAYVIGASMLVSRRFIDSVGLMDPRYFLYSEEHDWAHRGREAGFLLAWAPKAIVFHKHGATIGTASSGGSALSLFYLFRNKAAFAARYHPALLPIALAWLLWDCCKFVLKGHPEKAQAAFSGLRAFPRMRPFQR